MAIEHAATAAWEDPRRQPVEHDRRLAVGDVHRRSDLVELGLQGRVVDLGRGRYVRSEEAQVQPAKAS